MADVSADTARIAAKIEELGENVIRALERRVLREAAKIVQQRALVHAPEDTGALKRGIKVRAGRRSRLRQSMNVVSTVPYAKVIEFGEAGRGRRVDQQPYMRPAVDETRADVLREFADGIRREIMEATV